MRYIVKGYTASNPDFTTEIEFDGELQGAFGSGERRYSAAWNALKSALNDSDCDSEYLSVFDECDWELREDLANATGQIVLHAESLGCENCQEQHSDNTWTDGCNDEPHGGFLLTFDPIEK